MFIRIIEQAVLGRLLLGVNSGQQSRDKGEGARYQRKVKRLDGYVANNAISSFGENVSDSPRKRMSCHGQVPTGVCDNLMSNIWGGVSALAMAPQSIRAICFGGPKC